MIKIYNNGQTFLDENLSFLLEKKYSSSLIILNSKIMNETDNVSYLLKVENDRKTLIACRLYPYDVLLYGDHECLDELLCFLNDNQYEIPGFLCSTIIGEHLNGYQKFIGMDFMEASIKTEESSSNVTIASLDDVEEIMELSMEFFSECGLNDQVIKDKIVKRIASYRLLKKDNKIIAMARFSYDTETSSRISMVFTRKEYRGKGYAREVVNYCKNEILLEGKIATLNVDQKNPISNHLYSSLGFKKVFSQGIYILNK